MHYTIQQWMLFFYIYCFIGWCFESTYVSIRKRRFVNRGFLHSPLLPIYGSGAVVMLLVTIHIRDHIVWMFLAGMVGATALELVVGLAMESIFKVKYWDYSNQKINYKGVICLSSSLCWGLFTVLLNKFIHKPVEEFVLGLPGFAVIAVVGFLSVIFVCDTVVSVKVALGIRDMLDVKVRLKKELGEIEEQLSQYADAMKEELEEKKDSASEQLAQLLDSLNEKLAELAGSVGGKADSLIDAANEKLSVMSRFMAEKNDEEDKEKISALSKLGERLKGLKSKRESQEKNMTYLKVNMLRRNPSATSGRFANEFSVLKTEMVKRLEVRRKEKKEEKRKERK